MTKVDYRLVEPPVKGDSYATEVCGFVSFLRTGETLCARSSFYHDLVEAVSFCNKFKEKKIKLTVVGEIKKYDGFYKIIRLRVDEVVFRHRYHPYIECMLRLFGQ